MKGIPPLDLGKVKGVSNNDNVPVIRAAANEMEYMEQDDISPEAPEEPDLYEPVAEVITDDIPLPNKNRVGRNMSVLASKTSNALMIDTDLMDPFGEIKVEEESLAVQYESASEEPSRKVKKAIQSQELLLDDDNLEAPLANRAVSVRSALGVRKQQSSGSTAVGSRIRGRTPTNLTRNINKQNAIMQQAFISRSSKQQLAAQRLVAQKFDGAFQKKTKKKKKKKPGQKRRRSDPG